MFRFLRTIDDTLCALSCFAGDFSRNSTDDPRTVITVHVGQGRHSVWFGFGLIIMACWMMSSVCFDIECFWLLVIKLNI